MTMQNRRCFDCKRDLPLDMEHFYRDRNSATGLGYRCRDCSKRRAASDRGMNFWGMNEVESEEEKRLLQAEAEYVQRVLVCYAEMLHGRVKFSSRPELQKFATPHEPLSVREY